jgi:hypothetical protein
MVYSLYGAFLQTAIILVIYTVFRKMSTEKRNPFKRDQALNDATNGGRTKNRRHTLFDGGDGKFQAESCSENFKRCVRTCYNWNPHRGTVLSSQEFEVFNCLVVIVVEENPSLLL